jgi:tight adherence protein B
MTPILILGIGLVMVAVLTILALAGPSAGKATARRLETLKDRHSTSQASLQQAQMRRILASRDTRMDTLASRLIPNPALLRLRLSKTGKTWTLGQYAMVSAGLLIGVSFLLIMRGMPILLSLALGVFSGLVIPHMVTGSLIKRRINKFTNRFPDAIELLVRGRRPAATLPRPCRIWPTCCASVPR